MSPDSLHPLAEGYLVRLRQAGRELPQERRDELVAEIEGYLAEAIPANASDDEALTVLERLGAPGEIIEAEQSPLPAPTDRRSWREWAAVVLLPLGGFALGVGWLVGLVLLWSSRLWTTRDKVIGTLIVPGGIATVLLVVVVTATKRHCTGFTTAVGHTNLQCTPSGGPSAGTSALEIALLAFVLIGPIVTAVYLARRARSGSAAPAA